MANIKSQKKRNRQNVVRNERNKAVRSEVKTRMKNALDAAEAGDADVATEATKDAQKKIDMAVSKGVMKKNTAARRKSRLQREVNRLLGS
ncbi:MAG: 30S ribosomal protein S20 [Acidimicrobiia bacterium]|nr:30S ribosomal protein S20 [Acidimicrobiia bacterium]